jgi:hypothetical protein
MIFWALALIVVGVLVGIFVPIMFLVAAAGFVLLIVVVSRGKQRASSPNRPE